MNNTLTIQKKSNIPWTKIVPFVLFVVMVVLMIIDRRWVKGNVIAWDIWSYYAYLPATFLEQDLSLSFMNDHPEYVQTRYWPVQAPNGNWVIKTSMGMAILYLPYFILGHIWALIHTGMDANGFSQPYQIMILLSGAVHMLIGLLVLRKVLLTYYSEGISAFVMLLVIVGTNAGNYVYNEGVMAHIHNFMLIAIFLRLTQLWHTNPSWKRTIQLGLLSGLIALVRPNNVLIGLVFILYQVYNLETLKQKIKLFWEKRMHFVVLALLAFSIWIPQLIYWKTIAGTWLFNSYVGEGFFFDRPRFYLALFSYTKGWFVYTPLAILGVLGVFLVWRRAKDFSIALPVFMLLNLYVVFSWWCWWYGGGFGQRALIDSYPILAIGMAALLQELYRFKLSKFALTPIFLFFIYLNIFQSWQYRFNIIHWDSMTKEAYWAVFLKTKPPVDYEKKYLRSPNVEAALKGEVAFW